MLAFILAASLSGAVVAQATPQPIPTEPPHLTVEAITDFIQTEDPAWQGTGNIFEGSARAEFPIGSLGRFADTLHASNMSSQYTLLQKTYAFNDQEWDDEFDYEFGSAQYPYGVGIGYLHYSPLGASRFTYSMHGFGAGLDKWPNYYLPVSIYASAWLYPSVTTSEEYVYDIWRYDAGVNLRFTLVSPFSFKFGIKDETWIGRNGDSKNYRFFGPYAGISYWR